MLIAIASAKGAPGVTTTALGLTFQWPRPALLVEADLSGSSIMSGFFGGQFAHDIGIGPLAIAESQGALTQSFANQITPLLRDDDTKQLLPGLVSPAAAPAARDLWGPLASHLKAQTEADVIVDLGRLDAVRDDREVLLALADVVVIVTSSRFPDVVVTRALVAQRLANMDTAARELSNLAVLTVGPGRPLRAQKIAKLVALPSIGEVAFDPVNAEVLSVGAKASTKWNDSRLIKSYDRIIPTLQARSDQRRAHLGQTTEAMR